MEDCWRRKFERRKTKHSGLGMLSLRRLSTYYPGGIQESGMGEEEALGIDQIITRKEKGSLLKKINELFFRAF